MIRKSLILMILISLKGYQYFLSPAIVAIFGASVKCRFSPTCSSYAIKAYGMHGFLKGTWLVVVRLLSCHPFSEGGEDPVPKAFTFFKKRG